MPFRSSPRPDGYGKALEEYDARLPEVFAKMKEDDLLMITADHGNDPVHQVQTIQRVCTITCLF